MKILKQSPFGFIPSFLTALALWPSANQTAQAGDLFNVTARDAATSGATLTVSAGSSSVVDLVSTLINAKDQFAAFSGVAFNAGLRYADVPNAMTFTANAPGTFARLNIPVTGFSRTFAGPTRQDVENQIEDFLKKDGSSEMAKFLKAMNARSAVAVSDGNPNSTTAYSAGQSYENYAMTFAETNEEKDSQKQSAGRVGAGVVADVGTFDANGISGKTYSLPLYARFKISDRVGLNFDIPLSYVDVEGAQIFGGGLNLGMPIKAIAKSKGSSWFWQVAPSIGVTASGSKDFAAGGLLVNGGLNSLLSHDFGPVTLSLGTHFSGHEGVPLTISSYRFDPGVSQYILKNGLKLDVPFGRRWVFDVYAIHTKFIKAAAVNQYATVGGEIGYRLLGRSDAAKKKNGYIKVGVYADLGKDFTSAHAQFGTGWKF